MSDSLLRERTLARCQALQLLFQAEACGRSIDDVLASDYVLSEGPLLEYAEQLARGAGSCLPDLDAVLTRAARNWSLSRMSATDRNLLRLALYEILYVDDVDASVSINECVELAKAFGSSDESSRFVNGILGSIVTDIDNGVDVVKVAADEAASAERKAAEAASTEAAEAAEATSAEAAETEPVETAVAEESE